jgi:hypothetical protein
LIRVEVSCLHFRSFCPEHESTFVVVPFGIATSRKHKQALTRYNQYISDYEYSYACFLYHILRKSSNPVCNHLPANPYLSPTDLAMIFLTGPSRRVNACSPRVATTNLSEVARTVAARDCRFSSANSVHQPVLVPQWE